MEGVLASIEKAYCDFVEEVIVAMGKCISVIVPVYNVEKYLCQCVDSILGQTYRDLEVILVDDGSPDGCPQICDEYARKDGRVKVIHKKNGGLSDARNAGLEMAGGEYVIFVDSDDFWKDESVLSRLVEIFEGGDREWDFVNFNCQYFYQQDNVVKPWAEYPDAVLHGETKKEIITQLIAHGMFPMSACMKLIKRKFLVDSGIVFMKGIVSEDIPWFLEVLQKSRGFKFVNEYAYVYRKQVAGTISSSFSEKKYNDLLAIVERETAKIQDGCSDIKLREALLSFMAYEYCILSGMVNNFDASQRRKQRKRLKQYDWLLKYDLNPKVRKVIKTRRLLGRWLTGWLLYVYIKEVVNKN